jgi:uncharacterized RDD family membrane protein YckC
MAKELKKASFIKRLCAYIIDYLIIVLLVSLLASPFTDTKKVEKIENESNEIVQKYQAGEISSDEYMQRYSSVYYSLSRNTGVMTFITIILDVIYFVVFQLYNKGQTIGKKLLKIKVVSDNGDLSMNQMIFRSLIANMILSNIINFGLITFTSKNVYLGSSITISMIQYVIMFISIIMATTKEGRTIHDRIAHTRVVKVK